MSVFQNEDSPGSHQMQSGADQIQIPVVIDMDSSDIDKTDAEFHLASDTVDVSPRSTHTGASSSEIFSSPKDKGKTNLRPRPKSQVRTASLKMPIIRPIPPSSSIPLPVKTSVSKIPPLLKSSRSVSRTSSIAPHKTSLANKHTLEIQFINKNKRYIQMRKELTDKQKPVLDLYHNLMQIKKRLEELGKNVKLEDIKLVSLEEYKTPLRGGTGGGEQVSIDVVNGMKSSIEEIPKTLMDICKNLLSRRALIVELLESVTKSEIDVNQVSDKIESLKGEGKQLQQSLEAVIQQHESKISELVSNWQKLLSERQCYGNDSRVEELENRLKEEERLRQESTAVIHDLQRKLDDRKLSHEKSIAELNGVLQTLREQAKKLEQDLENERKTSADFKSRNSTNGQNLKMMRSKITDLENEKKEVEASNSDLQRKVRLFQEQMKQKESQWLKEKEEMNKSLKHQENLLQKLTADKNQFETRIETVEGAKTALEEEMENTVTSLQNELEISKANLTEVMAERDEAVKKYTEFEKYAERMGLAFKNEIKQVSDGIEWGKKNADIFEANEYIKSIAKEHRIRELEDKVNQLEAERNELLRQKAENVKAQQLPPNLQEEFDQQSEQLYNYQALLAENKQKLKERLDILRTTELQSLRNEILQLKGRQSSLEEEDQKCSVKDVQLMLDEGKQKLTQLIKKSLESEARMSEYVKIIEDQKDKMNQMDNLLRYRENMANVIKSSRNELLLEKESLARYSREVRAALAEVTSQGSAKDKLIRSLNEKISSKEAEIRSLEQTIRDLELKLQITNEKRYKLQETVGTLEKELQQARTKLNQASKRKSCLGWGLLDSVYEVVDDKKPNKKLPSYNNRLMATATRSSKNRGERQYLKNSMSQKAKRKEKSENTLLSDFSYRNFDFTEDSSSVQSKRRQQVNHRSLMSLSLHTVDFIKTKLNFLATVDTPLAENPFGDANSDIASPQESRPQLSSPESSERNLNKILRLTAHRYEYLHRQTQQSYDDLSNLVKLAVTNKSSGIRK